MISSRMPLELKQYSDLSRHIKEPQNGIYCLNFFKKRQTFKAETLFHTRSKLCYQNIVLSFYSFLRNVFFTM